MGAEWTHSLENVLFQGTNMQLLFLLLTSTLKSHTICQKLDTSFQLRILDSLSGQ